MLVKNVHTMIGKDPSTEKTHLRKRHIYGKDPSTKKTHLRKRHIYGKDPSTVVLGLIKLFLCFMKRVYCTAYQCPSKVWNARLYIYIIDTQSVTLRGLGWECRVTTIDNGISTCCLCFLPAHFILHRTHAMFTRGNSCFSKI